MVWVGQKKGMSDKENSEWATPTRKGRHLIPFKSDQHLRAPHNYCAYFFTVSINKAILPKISACHEPGTLPDLVLKENKSSSLLRISIASSFCVCSWPSLGMSLYFSIITFSTINPRKEDPTFSRVRLFLVPI